MDQITKAIGILLCVLPFFISGCSQESNGVVSKAYHNTTARYNAYFLARERMKEAEKQLEEMNKDDYNNILNVLIPVDTNQTKSLNTKFDDIIKKASLPIRKHKNSKWVDVSYVLVGRSRVYKGEFKLATETFKYVNGKGKDVNARHSALIHLMRLFLIQKDYKGAASVGEYLSKEKLNEENTADYHLTLAQLHKVHEDYDTMISNLEQAIPLIKKRDLKSRVYFILGQLYQLKNQDEDSYKNYQKVLKHNPPYELSFYTRLYSTQVSDLKGSGDRKKIEKYFSKLLRDLKNKEYKDKILYEMAKFELKQNNTEKAITYLKQSLQENTTNRYQKGASYLKLGEVYYSTQRFELSKLYYDSTVSVWDKSDKNYKAISERHKVLQDFVTQYQIVKREDSLLKLAAMDSVSLRKLIDEQIALEEKRKKEEEERLAKLKEDNESQTGFNNPLDKNNQNNFNNQTQGGVWYFYNPTAINAGLKDFEKKWGKRKLEDNWRRQNKEQTVDFNNEGLVENNVEESDTSKKEEVSEEERKQQLYASYYKDIPFTQVQKDTSHKRISVALFKLGKIYNYKLSETENSVTTFKDLIKRYPEDENKAESYYLLHFIQKKRDQKDSEKYKGLLLEEFPNSLFAKMLLNPDYLQETRIASKKASLIYKEAYEQYETGNLEAADSLIQIINTTYPENNLTDKVQLLKVLIIGKHGNKSQYIEQLTTFIDNFKNSDLIPLAEDLLKAAENSEKQSLMKNKLPQYTIKEDAKSYVVTVFPNDKANRDEMISRYMDYNRKFFPDQNVKCETFSFTDTTFFIIVKEFEVKEKAGAYVNQLQKPESFLSQFNFLNYQLFVINEENYQILINGRELTGYIEFYNQNY